MEFEDCSYYGRLNGPKPIRSFSQDMVKEKERFMLDTLHEMEERLKRHVTECKREMTKEFEKILKKLNIKAEVEPKKEKENGSKSVKGQSNSDDGSHSEH